MRDINEARKAFEQELQKLMLGNPAALRASHQTTERLIDLIVAVRDQLRKRDEK